MTRHLLRSVALPVTVLALVAGLAACSGDDDKKSSGQTSPGASASPSGQSADQLAQQLLATATASPPIASAQANVQLNPQLSGSTPLALTADVIEVSAADTMTVLHWRLRSTSGDSVQPSGTWLNGGTAGSDTSQVAMVDTAGKLRLLPFKTDTGDYATGCICSPMPRDVDGTGVDMYATYPALAASATTVDVALPQFPVMKGVKVTR
ncbi:hypothetical protein [Angustibacter luteus]|uniref:Lipoprotein n=1 Tax=Angustibacter luteus TaxID=658456 RepID=A0ABW1J9Q8_9ACTN